MVKAVLVFGAGVAACVIATVALVAVALGDRRGGDA